jgi:hypothetical protein
MADANIGDAFGLAGTYEKGITIAGKYGTPRLYDTGEPTNVFPQAVILVNLSGVPYVASGGGGGGGGAATITDGVTPTNVLSVEPPGTAGIMAASVQGVPGGVAMPVSIAASVAVTGAFFQATQPVSGTFFQATQPVSIASMPSTPVTGTFWQTTQPVSGTFFQATQPVSIASMPSTPVTGAFWQTTQPVSIASASVTSAVQVTPTVTVATYAAGNEVGGLLTFANAFRSAGSGIIQSVVITCKSIQTAIGMKLYLFKANPSNTTWTDKTAPAINAADITNLVGVYSLANGDSGLGTVTLWNLPGIGQGVVGATTSLYGVLVTTGAPAFASTNDITVTVSVLQD